MESDSGAALSIVIPTYNEAANIGRLLRGLVEQDFDVVVVDGHSSDATLEIASRFSVRTLVATGGRGGQMRAGAESASGGLILFLHADCRIDVRALTELQRAWASKKGAYWGCFRQRIRNRKPIYRWLEMGNLWRAKWWRRPFGDQGIFVDRQTYDSIGGMPDVPLMEDVLLAQRLAKIAPPVILRGPIWISSRRWERHGPWRQTWLNWRLQRQFRQGVPIAEIARQYRPESDE
jgi:rSAM/selenodomain-associated transferase 2